MASYKYVYHMDGVSKTYPGGKKVFENIRLHFLQALLQQPEQHLVHQAVTLGPCAVAHGNLSVSISSTPVVSQPNPLAGDTGSIIIVVATDAPDRIRKGMGQFPIPVIVLARLAVSTQDQGKGIGVGMLKEAIRLSLLIAEHAGIRALMTHPELIILDEATEGLAPLIVNEIWNVISNIRDSGIATLIVDRDYRRVLAHSDSAIVLQKGLVELSGSAEHVASDSALTKLLGV